MDKFLAGLDLETLKILYEKEAAQLRNALINGAQWDEVREQRLKVTELSIVIHQKRNSNSNPAETSVRETPNN